VLINGYSYPKEYNFEDLQYFIDSLLEESLTTSSVYYMKLNPDSFHSGNYNLKLSYYEKIN